MGKVKTVVLLCRIIIDDYFVHECDRRLLLLCMSMNTIICTKEWTKTVYTKGRTSVPFNKGVKGSSFLPVQGRLFLRLRR